MQSSFCDVEYAAKKKLTRRDRFLAGIHAATPWAALEAEIEPFYPTGEGRGRPLIGLSLMLRMYVAHQCFGLSDEGTIVDATLIAAPPSTKNTARSALCLAMRATKALRNVPRTRARPLNGWWR